MIMRRGGGAGKHQGKTAHGVPKKTKKQTKKMSAAKKKAYKSRTTKKGAVYLYDKKTGTYSKTTQAGAEAKAKGSGIGGPNARYRRVSERTYLAGTKKGPRKKTSSPNMPTSYSRPRVTTKKPAQVRRERKAKRKSS